MAYCTKCGNEIPEGAKFCTGCGITIEGGTVTVNTGEEPVIYRVGKYFGILLMIISFVDFMTDPALLTILLSIAIIAGCIYCFTMKFKLKGFTVIALIAAVICLLCGISQARKIGLTTIPGSEKAVQKEVEKTEAADGEPTASEESESQEDPGDDSKPDGVTPELKEFLDLYEAFMDEYVAFLTHYKANPEDTLSLLAEYNDIMAKYEDFAEKLDAYDTDEMSTADWAYYYEVINRCNQKICSAY